MNKYLKPILFSLFSLCLTSCGVKTYEPKDYMLDVEYDDEFRILQLNDTHLANKDNQEIHFRFLDETVRLAEEDGELDLIVLDGDVFTFGDKKTAKNLFSWLDSKKINWTLTFGNHDEQCYFSVDWLTRYLNNLNDSDDSYCVFRDYQDDDITGNANFVINLKDGDVTKYQVYIFDSNRYLYGVTDWGYDKIHDDQVEWYETMVNASKINGNPVESIAFFHIPLPEMLTAYNEAMEGNTDTKFLEGFTQLGEGEGVSCSSENSGLFDKALELGSTKGFFFAHDHVNNYAINYKGIILSYGIHSTNRIYMDEDFELGGQVITIRNGSSIELKRYLHSYGELD